MHMRSNGHKASTWGRWWKPPSSPVDQLIPATSCRFSNLNQNARALYPNEAGVMYITPVTLDFSQDLYGRRNLRWKIQVFNLKCNNSQNQSHHWLASHTRTSENQTNTRKSYYMRRYGSKQLSSEPLKCNFDQHDSFQLLLAI